MANEREWVPGMRNDSTLKDELRLKISYLLNELEDGGLLPTDAHRETYSQAREIANKLYPGVSEFPPSLKADMDRIKDLLDESN